MSQHSLAYFLLEEMLKRNFSREKYPGLYAGDLEYARTEQGKPYLKHFPEIQFNISHCPYCVACAISGNPVGVDVEKRFPWKENLARHICHPAELEMLLRLDDAGERQAWLNRIWSRKESYLKYVGIGLRTDLRELCVIGSETPERSDFRFWELQTENFTLAVCAGSGSTMELEKIELNN